MLGHVAEPATVVEVRFDSGQEVLSSYWGYLANGGLVIANHEGIELGGPVSLQVVIASAGAKYRLDGKIIKRHPEGHKMVVAFDPDQPHDMLITEALAETENTPPRKHRRYRIDVDGEIAGVAVRIVNVSQGGLCLTFSGQAPAVAGDILSVRAREHDFTGKVKWLTSRELGIQFSSEDGCPEVLALVEEYLSSLR